MLELIITISSGFCCPPSNQGTQEVCCVFWHDPADVGYTVKRALSLCCVKISACWTPGLLCKQACWCNIDARLLQSLMSQASSLDTNHVKHFSLVGASLPDCFPWAAVLPALPLAPHLYCLFTENFPSSWLDQVNLSGSRLVPGNPPTNSSPPHQFPNH